MRTWWRSWTPSPAGSERLIKRMPLKSRIRTIPDYPKPGIMFRDITTLLADPFGFRKLVG